MQKLLALAASYSMPRRSGTGFAGSSEQGSEIYSGHRLRAPRSEDTGSCGATLPVYNKSRSHSPRANKTATKSASRQGEQAKAMGVAPDKQHCQASTIEFEARNNDSSFSSDSDFDRNMDEMESDLLNE